MADKKLVQQAGLEMIAIVVSVLLALFLNNWWQDRQTDAGHTKTLALIVTELKANRTEQEAAIEHYRNIAPKIAAVLQDGVTDEEAREVMTECCELMSSGSGRTAHEMAIITGLYASLEPAVAVAIIAPFVGQEDLKDIIAALTNSLMTTADLNNPEQFFKSYYIFTTTLAPSMEELLGLTNAALTAIEIPQ